MLSDLLLKNCRPAAGQSRKNPVETRFPSSELGGKFIYIRYFPVRDAGRRYRGCLEVSQDPTEIRKLKGENRLLDWE